MFFLWTTQGYWRFSTVNSVMPAVSICNEENDQVLFFLSSTIFSSQIWNGQENSQNARQWIKVSTMATWGEDGIFSGKLCLNAFFYRCQNNNDNPYARTWRGSCRSTEKRSHFPPPGPFRCSPMLMHFFTPLCRVSCKRTRCAKHARAWPLFIVPATVRSLRPLHVPSIKDQSDQSGYLPDQLWDLRSAHG